MTSTTTHTLGAVARSLLEGPTNWINGAWEEGQGANTLTAVNPSTTEIIREVPVASVDQAERAVLAARRAFDSGPWATVTPRERCDLLLGLADLMERNYDDLVEIVVTEVGSPITLSRAMQVGMPIANVRWA